MPRYDVAVIVVGPGSSAGNIWHNQNPVFEPYDMNYFSNEVHAN
jgi:hypothetical protein